PRTAEQIVAGWGARVFPNYETMLQEARPDALWICVAPHLQKGVTSAAAKLGVPFFVEPPGAESFASAAACARLVVDRNLVTAVGFNGRYADIAEEARQYLGANPIPLVMGWWLCRPGALAQMTAEKLLWFDACRFIDALRFFCGEVQR